MTVLVALPVPCKELNPMRRNLTFEPGIIIAADTRFTYPASTRPPDDDGLKAAKLSDFAVAGFSGSGRVAEAALSKLTKRLGKGSLRRPNLVAGAAGELLRQAYRRFGEANTTVFLAARTEDSRSFNLYRLSAGRDFLPERRSGAEAAGTGAATFPPTFESRAESLTFGWLNRKNDQAAGLKMLKQSAADTRKVTATAPPFDVPLLDVAGLVVATLDEIIEKASIQSVGGAVQALRLDSGGVKRIWGVKSTDDGATFGSITQASPLRPPSDIK